MNWEMVNLTSICRPRQWKTLSMEMLTDKGYSVYGANGKIGFYKDYTHEFPTLAITCRGATCGSVHITEAKSYINGNAMALDSVSKEVDIKFLYYYFILRGFKDVISGSAQPQITGEGLSQVQVPLPPLSVQKRIAQILDEADELKRKDKELLKKYDELAQSIFIDMFGDPGKNEKGWEKIVFSDILEKIESGWSPQCLERQAEKSEWGILKLGAVTKCTYKDNENKALPSFEKPREEIEVKEGDLLFSRKNTYDLVAACALVRQTRSKLMLSDLIFRLKMKKHVKVSPVYLHALLTFPTKMKSVQSLANGAAGSMPNISKKKLSSLAIELPPFTLQKEFEAIIDTIEKNKNISTNAVRNSANLFQTLIQKAFKGELT